MTARLYTTVYAANDLPTTEAEITSKSLGTVNVWTELEYTVHEHGTGLLTGKINRHHTQAALLQQDRYVLVHSDAGVVGGAFLEAAPIDLSAAQGPGDEWATWAGRGQIAILERGAMDATSNLTGGEDPIDGYWDLDSQGAFAGASNAHPIPMFKRALVEMQLNSPSGIADVDHSSWTYDADTDATAVPFLAGEAQGAEVGDDGLSLLQRFDQLGGVTFVMSPLFKLDAYLTHGTDRSGAFGAATVRFEKGVNIAAAIARKVRGSVYVSHLIVGGAENTYRTVVDPDWTAGDLVRWGFLAVAEASDSDQLDAAGLAHIARRKRQTDAWELPLHDHGDVPASGIYEPAPDIADGHFWLGDTVSFHSGSGTYDANEDTSPVASITWRLKSGDEANGDYQVIVGIGSTFSWSAAQASQGTTPGSQRRLLLCEPGVAAVAGADLLLGKDITAVFQAGTDTPSGGYPSAVADDDDATSVGLTAPHSIARFFAFDMENVTDGYVSAPAVHAFRIKQAIGAANQSNSYSLAYSDDDIAYTVAATIAGDLDTGIVQLASPITARYWRIYSTSGNNGWGVYTWSLFGAGTAGTDGDGHPDLVGTSARAARCGHAHHVLRETAPSITDDETQGYPVTTLWTDTVSGGTWVLVDNTAGAAVWMSVGSTSVSSPDIGLPWFNVEDYGAVHDGVTDDTVAIQAAIDAAEAAGGGVVYFPNGVYSIQGALQDTGGANAQILLPTVDYVDAEQVTIHLLGETPPPPIMSVIGTTPVPDGHAILKSSLAAGTGSILSGYDAAGYANYTNVYVKIENLTFRTVANPTITALDLHKVGAVYLDNVVADVGSYYVEGLTEPTTATSFGVRLPGLDNGANTKVGVLNVIGFYKGVEHGEHLNAEQINVWGCKQALIPVASYHASHIKRLMTVHCGRGIVPTGRAYLHVDQFNVEHIGSGDWQETVYDIDDAGDLLYGSAEWKVTLATVGHDSTFTVNSAANFQHWEMGDAPSGGGSPTGAAGGDLSGTYPNPSVIDDSHSHTAATLPAGSGLIYLPLTTVVAGIPELVWDGDNSLIPTGS